MSDGFETSVLITQYVESFLLRRTVPLTPGSANASPQVTASPLPVVANKVLLEHSHNPLICVLSVAATAELSGHNREYLARKAKTIYCLAFYRKSLPTLLLIGNMEG